MLNTLLDTELFHAGNWTLTVGRSLGFLCILFVMWLAWKVTKAVWRVRFYSKYDIEAPQRRKFEKYIRQLIILLGVFASCGHSH